MNLVALASHTVDLDLLPEAPVVLDVGCRWFDFTWQIFDERPEARVIAIDPATDVEVPPLGTTPSNRGGVDFVRAALVGTGGPFQRLAHFSTGEGDFLTTLDRFHEAEFYEVACVKITELMDAVSVEHWDLVKLDCEGSEFGILEHWPGPIATQISVEFHDWDKPQYRNEGYYDRLWKALPWYRVVQHEFSKQGTGVGHWDSLLVLR